MGALDGKVALVTGAARGLGRESAKIFAREGARVVVADINPEGGEETVELIKEAGGVATFVAADVSRPSDAQHMVRAAVETYGGLDCAVNNAVVDVGRHPLAEIPEQDWDRSIAVNLTGVFLGMKSEIPAILERGGGAIVNVSSGNGMTAAPRVGDYLAAKHGLLGLTKVAALDYGRRGIRVNAVGPGVMWTPAFSFRAAADRDPQHIEQLMSRTPIGRFAEPEEVGEAVVWLCTDAASFVLGHTLVVDGGAAVL